jgi:hypothetical protein
LDEEVFDDDDDEEKEEGKGKGKENEKKAEDDEGDIAEKLADSLKKTVI